jgi:hypothetical protein
MSRVEMIARAICKTALSHVGTYGDEICCQYELASRREEGGHNEPGKEGSLRCCWEDFVDEAEAAIAVLDVFNTEWHSIDTVPKYKEDGDIPDEFIVWLFDPSNYEESRIQMGFWNRNYDGFQSMFEAGHLREPTYWAKVEWPNPPGEKIRAKVAISDNDIEAH